MRSIFDKDTRTSLIGRIGALSPASSRKWGKMDCFQMLRHCTMSEEMFLGKKQYDRLFIGRIFGKMALRSILKDEVPIPINQPTHPELRIRSTGDIETEKQKWIALIHAYEAYPSTDFIHPFFGRMTHAEIGRYVYKHIDHHLRQFGH